MVTALRQRETKTRQRKRNPDLTRAARNWGEIIKTLPDITGKDLHIIANELGLAHSNLYSCINGSNSQPPRSDRVKAKIADLLGITLDELNDRIYGLEPLTSSGNETRDERKIRLKLLIERIAGDRGISRHQFMEHSGLSKTNPFHTTQGGIDWRVISILAEYLNIPDYLLNKYLDSLLDQNEILEVIEIMSKLEFLEKRVTEVEKLLEKLQGQASLGIIQSMPQEERFVDLSGKQRQRLSTILDHLILITCKVNASEFVKQGVPPVLLSQLTRGDEIPIKESVLLPVIEVLQKPMGWEDGQPVFCENVEFFENVQELLEFLDKDEEAAILETRG